MLNSSYMTIDLRTFNDLFTDLRQRFVRFAAGYIHDEAMAEDIFIESMMVFWQSRETLPEDTNIPAYVLRTVRNKCIDHLRHLKAMEKYSRSRILEWDISTRIITLENFVPEEVFTKEIRGIVENTVRSLSEETRNGFRLSRIEGKSNKEISSIAGISEKGVEYHITKANRLLKEALKDYLTSSVIIFYLLQ